MHLFAARLLWIATYKTQIIVNGSYNCWQRPIYGHEVSTRSQLPHSIDINQTNENKCFTQNGWLVFNCARNACANVDRRAGEIWTREIPIVNSISVFHHIAFRVYLIEAIARGIVSILHELFESLNRWIFRNWDQFEVSRFYWAFPFNSRSYIATSSL